MRKYYTRPCNFYYGNYARELIKKKKALPLGGNPNISFDKIEVFERKKRGKTINSFCDISAIKNLSKKKKIQVNEDLRRIILKRKRILNLDFNTPKIMGVLNVTPDSFSDGGLYFKNSKAFKHVKLMLNSGAHIIDIGGESTRPGSKEINEKKEWKRVKKIIKKIKKNFPKTLLSLDTRKSFVMLKGISS